MRHSCLKLMARVYLFTSFGSIFLCWLNFQVVSILQYLLAYYTLRNSRGVKVFSQEPHKSHVHFLWMEQIKLHAHLWNNQWVESWNALISWPRINSWHSFFYFLFFFSSRNELPLVQCVVITPFMLSYSIADTAPKTDPKSNNQGWDSKWVWSPESLVRLEVELDWKILGLGQAVLSVPATKHSLCEARHGLELLSPVYRQCAQLAHFLTLRWSQFYFKFIN